MPQKIFADFWSACEAMIRTLTALKSSLPDNFAGLYLQRYGGKNRFVVDEVYDTQRLDLPGGSAAHYPLAHPNTDLITEADREAGTGTGTGTDTGTGTGTGTGTDTDTDTDTDTGTGTGTGTGTDAVNHRAGINTAPLAASIPDRQDERQPHPTNGQPASVTEHVPRQPPTVQTDEEIVLDVMVHREDFRLGQTTVECENARPNGLQNILILDTRLLDSTQWETLIRAGRLKMQVRIHVRRIVDDQGRLRQNAVLVVKVYFLQTKLF